MRQFKAFKRLGNHKNQDQELLQSSWNKDMHTFNLFST